MDAIIKGLNNYRSEIASYIKHIEAESDSDTNKKKFSYTKQLLQNQKQQVKSLLKTVHSITKYGYFSRKSLLSVLSTVNNINKLTKKSWIISEENPLSYRAFQILNHYCLAQLTTQIYFALRQKTDIEKKTELFLTDIIRANTKHNEEHSQHDHANLLMLFIKEIILENLNNDNKTENKIIAKKITHKHANRISKFISQTSTKVIAKFITTTWLPNKLNIDYKTDIIITLKSHITELINQQDKTGVMFNSSIFRKFFLLSSELDNKFNLKEEIRKLDTLITTQKEIKEKYLNNSQALIKEINNQFSIMEKVNAISDLTYITPGSTDVNTIDNIRKALDNRDTEELLKLLLSQKEQSKEELTEFNELLASQGIIIDEQVIANMKLIITKSQNIDYNTSNKELIKQLLSSGIDSINAIQNILAYYSKYLIKKSLNFSNIKKQSSKTTNKLYQHILSKQYKKISAMLDAVNYQGLSVLSKQHILNPSTKDNILHRYIKHYTFIGSDKTLPSELIHKSNLLIEIKEKQKLLLDTLKNKPKMIHHPEIIVKYKRIAKTAYLLKQQNHELTKDIRKHKKQKAIIDKNSYGLFITVNISTLLIIHLINIIFAPYDIFKYLTKKVYQAYISIKLTLAITTNRPNKIFQRERLQPDNLKLPTHLLKSHAKKELSKKVVQDKKEALAQQENCCANEIQDPLYQSLIPPIPTLTLNNINQVISSSLKNYLNNCMCHLEKSAISTSKKLYNYQHISLKKNTINTKEEKLEHLMQLEHLSIHAQTLAVILDKCSRISSEYLSSISSNDKLERCPLDFDCILKSIEHINNEITKMQQGKVGLLILEPQINRELTLDDLIVEASATVAKEMILKCLTGDKAALTIVSSTVAGLSAYTMACAVEKPIELVRTAVNKTADVLADPLKALNLNILPL